MRGGRKGKGGGREKERGESARRGRFPVTGSSHLGNTNQVVLLLRSASPRLPEFSAVSARHKAAQAETMSAGEEAPCR